MAAGPDSAQLLSCFFRNFTRSDILSLTSEIMGATASLDRLFAVSNSNSAKSAEQARIQREWQEQQNAKAMAFNRSEAEKNRNWQEMMSNTAHQREIADLRAAGLNPVLSAMGGNGASVTSGATASGVTSSGAKGDVDTSLNSALVGLLSSVYNRTTQLEAANINARTQEAVADKYNATSEIVAQIGAAASRYSADSSRAASQYAADRTDLRANIETVKSLLADLPKDKVSSAVDKAKGFGDKLTDFWKYIFDGSAENPFKKK